MSTRVDTSGRSVEETRHRILLTLLRVQFAASSVGVLVAIPLAPGPKAIPVFVGCGAALLALGIAAFAPMPYRTRARAYSLIFAVLALVLAVVAGPVGPTFLVMCGALILPLILLPPREAWGFVLSSFALVSLAGWAHIAGMITLEIPVMPPGPRELKPWLGGLITIVTISGPFAVLAGSLLRRYQEAHSRSDQLVQDLQFEIEERQAALEALQQAEQRLTHTQKLELLGQLAGGLAHDMNNALTAIMGEASFLKDSEAESREIIIEYSQHAAQLTRQLLMLGRKDVVQPRPLDFAEEVKRAVASARRLVPGEILVIEQYMTEPVIVQADPSQITQIVLNMVVNSRDAMVGGGELRVSVDPSPVSSSHADLTIADTGHGIAAENLERIFEPFYTSKPAGVGTGLGLANVKHLVDGLGGSLAVHSELGAGATFKVSLPLVDATPHEEAQVSRTEAAAQKGASILLVDDSETVRLIARAMLERAGYDVTVAGSGSEAIARLTEGEPVDLVITDVVMPNGSGSVLIEWIRRERPEIPVLVISGYTEDEQLTRGMRTGELPFLRKPFSADDLALATQKVLQNTDHAAAS